MRNLLKLRPIKTLLILEKVLLLSFSFPFVKPSSQRLGRFRPSAYGWLIYFPFQELLVINHGLRGNNKAARIFFDML